MSQRILKIMMITVVISILFCNYERNDQVKAYRSLGNDPISSINEIDSREHDPVILNSVQSIFESTSITDIVGGVIHTCALLSSGGVKCWGDNSFGQLGNNSTVDHFTPAYVDGLYSGVSAVASGESHTCVINEIGGVECWGWNSDGQLGDNSTTTRLIPVTVDGLPSGVIAISAGIAHTCALTDTGGVKCWGDNINGQLGDNTTTDRHTPVNVYGLTSGVTAISADGWHTCALTSTGGVKCWGNNYDGQLGDNTKTDRHIPVNVYGLTSGVNSISTGSYHTCAIVSTGGVKCWGYNNHGQLGDNTTTLRLTPVNVTNLPSGVLGINAGTYHTCAVTTSNGIKCWGRNTEGQLGDNTTTERHTPNDVYNLTSGMGSVGTGQLHTCGITLTGDGKCWGINTSGQLGDNSSINRVAPVDIAWVPYYVSGTVIDRNGDPLKLVKISSNLGSYTYSDEMGSFFLELLSGTQTISAHKNGYSFYSDYALTVPPNLTNIDFTGYKNHPENGYATWAYGNASLYQEEITYYNTGVRYQTSKIKYLFPKVGHISSTDFSITQYSVRTIAQWIDDYKVVFPSENGYRVYAMLDGGDISSLSNTDIISMADNLAVVINNVQNIDADGWMLDIEPTVGDPPYESHYQNHLVLLEELNERTTKPVALSILMSSSVDKQISADTMRGLFRESYFVTLMLYDYARDLDSGSCAYGTAASDTEYPYEDYEHQAINSANLFIVNMDAYGFGMIGVPAVATHHEFTTRADAADNTVTIVPMDEYLAVSFDAIDDAQENVPTNSFMGLSIWTMINEPVGSFSDENCPYLYSTFDITDEEWVIIGNYGNKSPYTHLLSNDHGYINGFESSFISFIVDGYQKTLKLLVGWAGGLMPGESRTSSSPNALDACALHIDVYDAEMNYVSGYSITAGQTEISLENISTGTWTYEISTDCTEDTFYSILTTDEASYNYLPLLLR